MTDAAEDRHLTTKEVAARLRMTEGGLRYWRWADKGPPSFKSGRTTLYSEAEVIAWEQRQKRETTRGDALGSAEQGAA